LNEKAEQVAVPDHYSAAVKALGVSRKTLSTILNGHAGMRPEMAIRLSIAFDTSAESWLAQIENPGRLPFKSKLIKLNVAGTDGMRG